MLNPPSTSTRLVDLSEVYAARRRGLEALRQSIVITKNPFLIAMADGEIPPIVEFNELSKVSCWFLPLFF